MASAEVHVSLPAFSRLCLLCNTCSGSSLPAGGLEAVLTDPATLTELQDRLTGLERELPLVSGVCPSCRRRLLRCQRLLVRFQTAAAALAATYRRAAAARLTSGVLLRRGRRRAEVPYSACCRLAADRPGSPTSPADLVRHLVTEEFGAEALQGRVVISSVAPPPAQGNTGPGEEDDSEPGQRAADRNRVPDGGEGTDEDSDGSEYRDGDPDSNGNRDRLANGSARGAVSLSDDIVKRRNPRSNSRCGVVKSPPESGSRRFLTTCVSEDAEGDCVEDTASQVSSKEEEAAVATDDEEYKVCEDWSDKDWRAGRSSLRTRRRVLTPAGPDPPPQPEPPTRPPPAGRPRRDARYCHMCRQTFRSQRNLQAHIEKLHKLAGSAGPEEPARVWCPACSALLPPDDVTGHVTRHHGGRLECSCCGMTLDAAADAARHCVDRHTANYMCIVCLQMYSSQDQLISHMNSSHEPPSSAPDSHSDPVAAVYSDLVRRLRGRARRLQLNVLGRTAVRCPYCGQTCSLHYLRTHLYKHRAAGFRCHVCEKRFKFPVSFQKHLLLHAGRAQRCPQCEAVFSSRSNLLSHLRTHSAERLFSCDRCQKRFKFKQTRDAHMRRFHGGGATKVCDVCGAEFRLQYQLTVHLARHRSGRTIRCPLCPRLYELNLDLKRHLYSKHKIRVAEAERRFPQLRRRPNTAAERTDLDAPSEAPQRSTSPSAGSALPSALPSVASSAGTEAAPAETEEHLSADDPPPAADGFPAGTADEGAAPLEVGRLVSVPPELLSTRPPELLPDGAGQVVLLVDGANVGVLMRDVLPASSGTL